jgi:predicted lipid-binding transport protein (Tim44 family)
MGLLLVGVIAGLLVLLVLPMPAHALGGGGIGGFGDGGGGGGGGQGFSGGVHVIGGGGGEEGWTEVAARVVVIALIVFYWIIGALRVKRRSKYVARRESVSVRFVLNAIRRIALWPFDLVVEWLRLRSRLQQVRLAAAEAAESDVRFVLETVYEEAEQLFRAIQAAWGVDDRVALAQLVGKGLMVEWEERLKGFARRGWINKIEVHGPVRIDYVGLRNSADEQEKRVVVRIGARVRDVVIDSRGNTIHRRNSLIDTHRICEYWTLAVSHDRWILVSIEQHHEGLHQLREPVIPSPWSDTSTLQREATLDQMANAQIDGSQIWTLTSVDLAKDARAAALDLSMVDDRFAPRVLTVEVEHAVRAWAEAIDGDDTPLGVLASSSALDELLYGGDRDRRQRVVIRGPRVRAVHIVKLEAHDSPPWMLVELQVSGRRYVEDRVTTTVLDGDKSLRSNFTVCWRMELTGDDDHPWRVAGVVSDEQSTSRSL